MAEEKNVISVSSSLFAEKFIKEFAENLKIDSKKTQIYCFDKGYFVIYAEKDKKIDLAFYNKIRLLGKLQIDYSYQIARFSMLILENFLPTFEKPLTYLVKFFKPYQIFFDAGRIKGPMAVDKQDYIHKLVSNWVPEEKIISLDEFQEKMQINAVKDKILYLSKELAKPAIVKDIKNFILYKQYIEKETNEVGDVLRSGNGHSLVIRKNFERDLNDINKINQFSVIFQHGDVSETLDSFKPCLDFYSEFGKEKTLNDYTLKHCILFFRNHSLALVNKCFYDNLAKKSQFLQIKDLSIDIKIDFNQKQLGVEIIPIISEHTKKMVIYEKQPVKAINLNYLQNYLAFTNNLLEQTLLFGKNLLQFEYRADLLFSSNVASIEEISPQLLIRHKLQLEIAEMVLANREKTKDTGLHFSTSSNVSNFQVSNFYLTNPTLANNNIS